MGWEDVPLVLESDKLQLEIDGQVTGPPVYSVVGRALRERPAPFRGLTAAGIPDRVRGGRLSDIADRLKRLGAVRPGGRELPDAVGPGDRESPQRHR